MTMIDVFKKSMMAEFEMSDLGLMHYFLGIEVEQSPAGIFISQKNMFILFWTGFECQIAILLALLNVV